MQKSTVLKIIQSFSKEEINEFNDFLISPYHNKKSGVIKLYNEVKKYYPDFEDENLDKEKLWSKLYPGKKYSYGVMKNLIYDITKLAESFITFVKYKKDELNDSVVLIKSLSERNLYSIIENKKKILTKSFENEDLSTLEIPIEDYSYNCAELYDLFIWQNGQTIPVQDIKRESKLYEVANFISIFLNLFFVHYHTKVSKVMIARVSGEDLEDSINEIISEKILNSIPNSIFEKILLMIKQTSEDQYKIFNCYYLGYKALSNLDDLKHYLRLKKFFVKNHKQIPVSSKMDVQVYLDVLITILKDKKFTLQDMEEELYDNYYFRFHNNLILDASSVIIVDEFISWLIIFFSDSNLKDLESFTNKYKDHLFDDSKEDILLLVDGIRLFLKHEYVKSLDVISKIKLNTFLGKNVLKKITLLIHYEMNDYESFLFASDSFLHFFKYTKTTEKNITTDAKVFCEVLGKLFKYRNNPDVKEIAAFEKRISNMKLAFKKWFLKKINELEKSQAKLSA